MKTDEIIGFIKKHLDEHSSSMQIDEVGSVIQVGDGIAKIYGLEKAMVSELLLFPSGIYGLVLNLDRETVGAAILGEDNVIKEGDEVRRTGKVFSVPVGAGLIGRVVNPLGQAIDGKGAINTKATRPIEVIASGVIDRQPVRQPLQTGIKAIDSMIPIGRGQRELIIGDRQTGKTAIALDAIINQKNENVLCIYVAIGQKQSVVARIVEKLRAHDAMQYTIVVSATANDPAPLQYIAPYSGIAMAEEFLYAGKDVLIVYDDLSKHAVAYRQMSLLLRRPPGREAYPGDVFYLHSRLLERAVKLSDEKGGGSITALPIIETQAGDISAYIPTNVISITDGQIYLEANLFYGGVRPAVNAGLSVSRVGGVAQIKAMRQVSGRLRIDLAQHRALSAFAQFGADLDQKSKNSLLRGEKLIEILKQDEAVPLTVEKETIIVYAGVNGFVDDIPTEKIRAFETKLFAAYDKKLSHLTSVLKAEGVSEKAATELNALIGECKQEFLSNANGKI
ncbi:MAG: F0F1 ATP synthase subunit alpha [Endomicrobiales bacterium]|nr:F0F1 ATP synthase subunit alpha [Endomicrobiales bacterium]